MPLEQRKSATRAAPATDRTAGPAGSRLATARIVLAQGRSAPVSSARPSTYNPARLAGSFVPSLTRKAFEKHGFSAASLLTDWARIVGSTVASYTHPERLKWPRGVEANSETDAGSEGRPGATLVLRVDPARALDVEYRGRQILERINAYFGYRAVEEMRIIQAPLEKDPVKPLSALAISGIPRPAGPSAVAGIEDPALKAALERLEAGVRSRKGRP